MLPRFVFDFHIAQINEDMRFMYECREDEFVRNKMTISRLMTFSLNCFRIKIKKNRNT